MYVLIIFQENIRWVPENEIGRIALKWNGVNI